MIEYRVQRRVGGKWQFLTDRHGKFYTYFSEAAAKKFGPQHFYNNYNPETNQWEKDMERHRIVKCDCEWEEVQ